MEAASLKVKSIPGMLLNIKAPSKVIKKQFEPLLLVPIGFGCILANIPLAGISEEGGLLYYVFTVGIDTGIFPLIIFMGVGALTDFGPMISQP